MINIKSKNASYGITFPTSVNEITSGALNVITKGVKLPKNYCIIALVFKTRLFDYCTMINSKSKATVGVVPIMAKISDEDSKKINSKVGDKIIIDRSSLERGVQIHLNTNIEDNKASAYFDSDKELVKDIITKKHPATKFPISICVLSFKIVPITDIAASVDRNSHTYDPFQYTEAKESNTAQ